MRILIWGAGAIGGTLGAYLISAGHDILFVDIVEAHVKAINQSGLQIKGPVDEFTLAAEARLPDQLSGKREAILLCTKSQHTRAATELLAPFLADDGFVMSVQNGLNELIIVSAKTHSGIWRDLAVRKRPTEVVMYQPILAQAEAVNLDLPLTRRWIQMIRDIENGAREQSLANLDELNAEFA